MFQRGPFYLFISIVLLLGFQVQANDFENIKFVKFRSHIEISSAQSIIKQSGFEFIEHLHQINWFIVKKGEEIEADESFLKNHRDVVRFEDNKEIPLFKSPNDPKQSKLKGFDTMGAEEAWDISTGSKNIVVAVSDSGIDMEHKDLIENFWINTKEIANNGIDDDNNGYVDDIHGWDWVRKDNDPDDDHGHGTHVAGTIGAVGNNDRLLAGINWSVSLMALKFISKKGTGSEESAVKSILYASDNGAHVINASWGDSGTSPIIEDAVKYALSKNVLFVAAAGNSKKNLQRSSFFPARIDLPGVLSVGSTLKDGRFKSSFTNYGIGYADVGAPGSHIISLAPGGGTTLMSGTSMAAPHVAGLAALILSVQPDLNNVDLENAIQNSVTLTDNFKDHFSTGGLAHAGNALNQLSAGPQVWPRGYGFNKGQTKTFTAFGMVGPVKWSTSNSDVAKINDKGELTALSEGSTVVSATDSQGNTYSNDWVRVHSNDSAGCNKAQSEDVSTAYINLFMLFMLLPLLTLYRVRRRY